jgi:hypothetical protein
MDEKCNYDGCEDTVCDPSLKHNDGRMSFCETHQKQLNELMEAPPEKYNPGKVIGFWIKANGGADKLSKTF